MPHVVTQACCGDASCVFACPVNCIHPSPDDPAFATAEMLYIDPDSCVDCGACVGACPVGAIVPDTKLGAEQLPFVDINAMFYESPADYPIQAPVPTTVRRSADRGPLRVAIVGSGPAALYAADELLKQPGVVVNVFERLLTPHGLVRAGVAPDHQMTKQVQDLFGQIEDQSGFGYFLGVHVGTDVTHDELLDHHHAVLYATGASQDRRLAIPGEDLEGSATATELVAWYNGHPDLADRVYDFTHRRAVVIGNGNVALDVARILTADPDDLASTDIADYALEALRESKIEEVVLLGRRGVAQAACALPELVGLLGRADVQVAVDEAEVALDPGTSALRATGLLEPGLERKIEAMEALSSAPNAQGTGKRIVFRYLTSATALRGQRQVTGVDIVHNELVLDGAGEARAVPTARTDRIEAGLVLRSIGYRGVAVAGMPFDERAGVIPHDGGRVLGARGGDVVSGAYVAGWIKRGPSGYIGTNKSCAYETVSNLMLDFNAGRLAPAAADQRSLERLVDRRRPDSIDLRQWRAVDVVERARGAYEGRPRIKLIDRAETFAVARAQVSRTLGRTPIRRASDLILGRARRG